MSGGGSECGEELGHRGRGLAGHGDDAVAGAHTGFFGGLAVDGLEHHHGHAVGHQRRLGVGDFCQEAFGDVDADGVNDAGGCLACHRYHRAVLHHVPHLAAVGGVGGLAVDGEDAVAVAQAYVVHLRDVVHAFGGVLVGDDTVAPVPGDADVDDYRQHEVEDDAGEHHHQAREGLFGAEFPGFGLLGQVLAVVGLVNHSGNRAVAAQGQPAYAVEGSGPRGLAVFLEGGVLAHVEREQGVGYHVGVLVGFAVGAFGTRGPGYELQLALVGVVFQQREPWVEKEVEAVDAHAEHACEDIVAELVYCDEQGQCQDKLKGFDEECLH